ncbi:MAG: TonB-dependent receptor, partial [Bacteroidetes bacterium]|nr:TonB-dependent receptor [Bacteroidota bacterium]
EHDFSIREKTFRLGGSQRLQVQDYRRVFLVPAYTGWSSGLWLSRNGRWREWTMDAVLRADAHLIWASWMRNNTAYRDARQFANVSAGLTMNRRLFKGISYEQNLLRQWRNPWLNELYSDGVHRGSGAYERGNRNLRAEHSLKWEHRLLVNRHSLFAEWTLFGNRVQHFMNLEPSGKGVLTVRGALPLFEYRQYNALFFGTNLQFRKTLNKVWQLQGRLDAVYARNLDSQRVVPLIPPVQASLGLSRKFGLWTFNLNPAYTAKTIGYVQGSDFLPPPADYLLIHADISMNKKLGAHELMLQLGVHNLGNKRYRDYLNRFRYFADEAGRNIWLRAVLELHRHVAREETIQPDEIQIIK